MKLPKEEISFWREKAEPTKYPELAAGLEVDTVIVGGGIAGVTAAYLLMRSGQKVAVIEKDRIGSGTTGHTTGKVTSQHNLIYKELSGRFGQTTARLYGQANQQALNDIALVIKKEKIDCGFTRADNYVFTADSKRISEFKKEAKVAAGFGLPASFETAAPLPFPIAAAVKFSNQAYMNAQQYIVGLAAALNGGGSYVFENSRALSIRGGNSPTVRTAGGQIRAKDIIVATNVPTLPLAARGTYCIAEYPHESYIVAAEVPVMPNGMYISPDKEHYSVLPVIHDGQKLLLIGGSNHIPGTGLGVSRHYKELAKYAEAKFNASNIKYKWKARDYIAYDKLPLVGKLYPWSQHIYTVTAFRKWGLTNSMVAAGLLRDLITGAPSPTAKIFDPHRGSAPASIPHIIMQSL